jgi:hypothetical protein
MSEYQCFWRTDKQPVIGGIEYPRAKLVHFGVEQQRVDSACKGIPRRVSASSGCLLLPATIARDAHQHPVSNTASSGY